MPLLDGLWRENLHAWTTFHQLCGRTVRECHLEGWLVDRLTAAWEPERTLDLLARLDLILSVLEPHGHSQN